MTSTRSPSGAINTWTGRAFYPAVHAATCELRTADYALVGMRHCTCQGAELQRLRWMESCLLSDEWVLRSLLDICRAAREAKKP